MPLFPDEFPFKRPTGPQALTPPPVQEVVEPVIETQPPAPAAATSSTPAPVAAPISADPEEPLYQPASIGTTGVEHERRRSPRQALLAKALVRSENGNTPGWKVDLINISMLGIRFRSAQSLLPGDFASVKLEVGPLRWATKLRVIHAESMDDGNYAIGCQFISNELARPARRAA